MTNPADPMTAHAASLTSDPTRPYRLISRDETRVRLNDADQERFDVVRQTIIDYGKSRNLDPIPAGRDLAIATADQLLRENWHRGAVEVVVREIGTVAADLQRQFNAAREIVAQEL